MKRNLLNQEARAGILERIAQFQQEAPRKWGKMDARQMICHCTDQLRLALGEKSSADTPTLYQRTLMKFVVLSLMPRIPANSPSSTPTEMDQMKKGTPPEEFEQDKTALIEHIERFVKQHKPAGKTYQPHPMFGPMSDRQWGKLAWLHLDYHLRQFSA